MPASIPRNPNADFLTPEEVAPIIRSSAAYVRIMIAKGTLPGVRIGRRLLVSRAALETMLHPAPKPAPTTPPAGHQG